jgi:hypothetical protein
MAASLREAAKRRGRLQESEMRPFVKTPREFGRTIGAIAV